MVIAINNKVSVLDMIFVIIIYAHWLLPPCHGVTLNLGILGVFENPDSFMSLKVQGSAINIACDALMRDGILDNITLKAVWRETYVESDGVGNCVDLVVNEDVDVIFGPPSSPVLIATGHLTSFWNFPHITWSGNSYELADKGLYTTLVRTVGPLSEVAKTFVTLFQLFEWKQVGMLYQAYSVCLHPASGVRDEFAKNNITIMQNIGYPSNTVLTDEVIDTYLTLIRQTSRIIFICVNDDMRRFMLRASKLGMCNGDFLFLYVGQNTPPTSVDWSNGDSDDALLREAFKHVIYVSVADWYKDEGKSNLDKFNTEVVERMLDPPWYSDYAKVNNVSASYGAQYLYDAMYLYGLWYNYSLEHDVPLRDGSGLLEFSKGLSFDGISGPCDIGDNADRIPYFWFWNYVGDNDEFRPEIVAISKTKDKEIVETLGFTWMTKDGQPPKDEPVCGFFGELCTVDQTDNSTVVIVTGVAIFIVIVAVAIIVYFWRKRQIENIMMQSIWKVDINQVKKSKVGVGSKNNQSQSQISVPSSVGNNSDGEPGVSLLRTVGLYKGEQVSIRTVKINVKHLSRDDLLHLKAQMGRVISPTTLMKAIPYCLQGMNKMIYSKIIHSISNAVYTLMKELHHDNVNTFIGACVDTKSPCVLFLYCRKGSLQDVLANDDIQLDVEFKHSLMMDITQGMYYIQQSKIGAHGNLKSSNCLIDNRWTLKITDYGLGGCIDTSSNNKLEEHQKYQSMLWTAPELLGDDLQVQKKSKEGDVYSYGIILHEILYRMGTFAGKTNLTAKDIIERVHKRDLIPCRPKLFDDNFDIIPAVTKLMQLCWTDNEAERPTFSFIRTYIKKNIPGINANIIDVVLQRLEKYAINLEDLVDQRTQQLMQEKQKTDDLLCRMLPPSCAEKLKFGEPIIPEIYESATVFFSDICGFTTISSKSSPIQVVDFLNDLFTCFDAIIANYDAYKVETVGDAYLVVSGIPKRNGSMHSGIIADMSLGIRQGVDNFKIKHMPSEKLRVRIGLHTGSCCAGVVGLSMPKYCLFGDTVNTASRMESNGESQKIHISESTCQALQKIGGYDICLRGEMPIKGKGIMTTYWLDSKKEGQLINALQD